MQTWLKRIGFFVAVVAFVLFTLPMVVRDVAVYAMLQLGAKEAHLKAVKVHWFDGRVELVGLTATHPEQPELRLDHLLLDIDLSTLLDQQLLVEQLTISGVELNVTQTAQALYVGPLLVPVPQGGEAAEPEPETEPEAQPSTWQVGVQSVVFDQLGGQVLLQGSPLTWRLDRVVLADFFQWSPETATRVELAGAINDAPIAVTTEGAFLAQSAPIEINSQLTLDKLSLTKLSRFSPIAAQLPFPLKGELVSDLAIAVVYDGAKQKIDAQTQGNLAWKRAALNIEGQALAWQHIGWKGKTDSNATLNKALDQTADGELSVIGFSVADAAQGIEASLGELRFAGHHDVQLALTENAPLPNINSVYDFKAQAFDAKTLAAFAAFPEAGISLANLALKGQAQLAPQLSTQGQFKGEISAQGLAASQAEQQLSLAGFSLTHDVTATQFMGGQPLALSGDLGLALTDLLAKQGPQQAELGSLTWDAQAHFAEADQQAASLNGELNLSGLTAQQSLSEGEQSVALASAKLSHQLSGQALLGELEQMLLDAQWQLGLSGVALATDPAKALLDELSLTGTAAVKPTELSVAGQLDAESLALTQPEQQLALDSLVLPYTLTSENLAAVADSFDAQAKLALTRLQGEANTDGQTVSALLDSLSLSLSAQAQDAGLRAASLKDFNLGPLTLTAPVENNSQTHLTLANTALAAVDWRATTNSEQSEAPEFGQLKVQGFQLSDLSMTAQGFEQPESEAFLSLNSVLFDGLDATELPLIQWHSPLSFDLQSAQVAAKAWVFNGLDVVLRRDEQGRLWPLDQLTAANDEAVKTAAPEAAAGEGTVAETAEAVTPDEPGADVPALVSLVLDGVTLNDAKLRWRDQDPSLTAPVEVDLTVNALHVGQLQPLVASAKTPIDLDATINQYAKLTLSADSALFSPLVDTQWQLNLSALDIPTFNGYIEPASGYYIQQGQLDFNSQGQLANEVISSKNTVVLRQAKVNQRNASKARELTSTLTMPLETVIVLLQDDAKKLTLNVPVNGAIDDIDVGYQGVVNLIAQKAIQQAALNYLSNALQPYGALVTLTKTAMAANNNGTFIRLKAVEFEGAVTELSSANRDYLDTVRKMMAGKPTLVIKMCPVLGTDDVNANREALLAEGVAEELLATDEGQRLLQARNQAVLKTRADAVKAYLATKLDAERLFSCYSPEVKPATQAAGVVELGF
ncbi:MAG: DUF748 domain-containing protein [Pontibacterium sp.]